jgi:hypothetical protein
VNARLSAEGGDARVPPAAIRSSSLFAEAVSRANAADARAAAADARAAAADARADAAARAAAAVPAGAAATVAVLSTLTDISVLASAGASAGASGIEPSGVFDCAVAAPGGQRLAFELDFFRDDDGEPAIEFVPSDPLSAAVVTAAPFLAQTIAFTVDQAPMFFGKLTQALRGASGNADASALSATTTVASRTPRTSTRTPRVLSARTPGVTPGNAPAGSTPAAAAHENCSPIAVI